MLIQPFKYELLPLGQTPSWSDDVATPFKNPVHVGDKVKLPDGEEVLRDEAFVEYVGPDESVCWNDQLNDFAPHGAPMLRHLVSAENANDARRPRGLVLVLQH